MPWIAVDCDLPEHPKMAALPTDAARYGWLVVLMRAKKQAKPGRFASRAHFREVLHRHAKHLPHYLEARLLEEDEDGALLVHGWQRYQWAWAKARQREDNGGTPIRHDKDPHARARAVPVPVDVDVATNEENGTLRARGTPAPFKDPKIEGAEYAKNLVPHMKRVILGKADA